MAESKQRKVITYSVGDNGLLGVHAISVVEYPAIEEDFVYLSAHTKLSAVNEERRMIYGALLVPNKEILRLDDQGNEYYVKFPPEVIMHVAHAFFKKNQHHNATYEHAVEVDGMTLVEAWLKEGDSDKSIALGLNSELPVGTWFGGMYVGNDDVWNDVKAGKVKGFSIEGLFAAAGQNFSVEDALLYELEELLKSHTS